MSRSQIHRLAKKIAWVAGSWSIAQDRGTPDSITQGSEATGSTTQGGAAFGSRVQGAVLAGPEAQRPWVSCPAGTEELEVLGR